MSTKLPAIAPETPSKGSTPNNRDDIGDRLRLLASTSSPTASPKVFTGNRRRTQAQRAQSIFISLVELLETDWKSVRSLNLGVRSGTSVVDELLVRKIQEWVHELHTICISSQEASDAVAKLARKLDKKELQQLQVMFDMTDHPFLSDFIRVMVYNTSHPFASTPVDINLPAQARKGRRAKPKARNQNDGPDPNDPTPKGPRPAREEVLRFAGYLPVNHPLVQKAYSLYLSRMPPETPGAKEGIDEAAAKELLRRAALEEYMKTYGGPSLHSAFYDDEASRRRQPEEQYEDMERRWKETTHTTLPDDTMTNSIMISDSLPAWLKMPEYKVKQLEQEAEARRAQQALDRLTLKSAGGASVGGALRSARGPRAPGVSTSGASQQAHGALSTPSNVSVVAAHAAAAVAGARARS